MHLKNLLIIRKQRMSLGDRIGANVIFAVSKVFSKVNTTPVVLNGLANTRFILSPIKQIDCSLPDEKMQLKLNRELQFVPSIKHKVHWTVREGRICNIISWPKLMKVLFDEKLTQVFPCTTTFIKLLFIYVPL